MIRTFPSIEDSAEEALATQLIADVMREITRVQKGTGNRTILRGGTAAKIGHGLARPSKDIDIDVVGDVDPWHTLQKAAEECGYTALARQQRRRVFKGTLLITDPSAGTVEIEVDVRRVPDPAPTEQRNGVLMYTAQVLIDQKLELLDLPNERLRAKDRYDLGWWINERIDHMSPAQRIELDRRLAQMPHLREAWDRNHLADRIMRRIHPDTVHEALAHALDHDPVVMQDRWPNGVLTLELNPYHGGALVFDSQNDAEGGSDKVTITQFSTDQAVERFMVRIGLWKPDEVPERMREMALERQKIKERPRPT